MKNKDKLRKMKTGYIKIPQVALNLNLSPAGYLLLSKLIDLPENFNPSYSWLEKQLNMSRSSLVRQFKVLRECQVINLLRKGTGTYPSVYEFNPPKQWLSLPKNDTRSSVLKNKLMQKGRIVSGKELTKARQGCPQGRHVDFIIPIVHKNVCGLNVPWNIAYLTWDEVSRKGNSFDGTNENISWQNIKSETSSG